MRLPSGIRAVRFRRARRDETRQQSGAARKGRPADRRHDAARLAPGTRPGGSAGGPAAAARHHTPAAR